MPVSFKPEAWRYFEEKRGDGKLFSVGLTRRQASYRVTLILKLEADAPRTCWRSGSIKYPKGRKSRDWDAELRFFQDWSPSSGGSPVSRPRASTDGTEAGEDAAAAAAPPREKLPRACHQRTSDTPENPRPAEKRAGGRRAGCGRPAGSYGPKRRRETVRVYQAAVKEGRLQAAQAAARNLPAGMRQAALAAERNCTVLGAGSMTTLRGGEVVGGRMGALRKLARVRERQEQEASAEAACREAWEEGVRYFRRVKTWCTTPAIRRPEDAHIHGPRLLRKAMALSILYRQRLEGATEGKTLERVAGLFEVSTAIVEEWEREYRAEGHITVRS